jgi:hypothetical protein
MTWTNRPPLFVSQYPGILFIFVKEETKMPAEFLTAIVFGVIMICVILGAICQLYRVQISDVIPLFKRRQKRVSVVYWGAYESNHIYVLGQKQIDLPQTRLPSGGWRNI